MKKFLNLAAALLLAASSIQAQKIDARLTRLLPSSNQQMSLGGASQGVAIDTAAVKKQINVSFNEDGTVRSFSSFTMLKEGADCPTAKLEALGVTIKRQIGRILMLDIPAESLEALSQFEEIESVNADGAVQLMNNNARAKSKVSEVATLEKATAHNLPQAYTGKGVVVGVVDIGIDFNHAAFLNADGSTRVKKAMVVQGQNITANTEDATVIKNLTTDNTTKSHGTHVAGTAAGSIVKGLGGTTLDKQGVAPEADLVLYGLGENGIYDLAMISSVIDAFDYARKQNKPCVVNLSMGNIANFHDGQASVLIQSIREYYKENGSKGLICVVSSGNSGNHQKAIHATLPAAGTDGYNLRTAVGESQKYEYNGETVALYEDLHDFFYLTDGSAPDVEAKVVNIQTGAVYTLAEKPLYNMADNSAVTSLDSYKIKDSNMLNQKQYVLYSMSGKYCFHEPSLKLAYYVKGTEGKVFRAMEKRDEDSAGFHSYSLSGYTEGNDNGAFNIDICGDEIIGVGAYVSAPEWNSIDGNERHYVGEWDVIEDAICDFSSWGTDDNGTKHPDVLAPGSAIASSYNIYDKSFFDSEQKLFDQKVPFITDVTEQFNRNQFYGVMQGTSMSAPHATGVIALWLQANPELTYADVRQLIKETSYNDEYTTNPEKIPSGNIMQAGFGKIDALKGLQKIKGVTAIQTVGADGERHATPATMYRLDDNCYNTLGQRVSKNAKGLVIYKGKVYLNR